MVKDSNKYGAMTQVFLEMKNNDDGSVTETEARLVCGSQSRYFFFRVPQNPTNRTLTS